MHVTSTASTSINRLYDAYINGRGVFLRPQMATIGVCDLAYQRWDKDGPGELRPAGELQTCRVRSDLHNGKFAWDLDLWHSFCWILDKGHQNGGYWALANLHRKDGNGEATCMCLDMPRDPNDQCDPYPPLGEWIRGSPRSGSQTFPRGQTQFTLSRKPRM